jgi:hypothetical protein
MKTIEQEIPDFTQCKPYQFTEKKMKGMGVIHPSVQEKLDKANDFIRRGKFPKI